MQTGLKNANTFKVAGGGANKQEDLRKSEKKLWIKISLTRI